MNKAKKIYEKPYPCQVISCIQHQFVFTVFLRLKTCDYKRKKRKDKNHGLNASENT